MNGIDLVEKRDELTKLKSKFLQLAVRAEKNESEVAVKDKEMVNMSERLSEMKIMKEKAEENFNNKIDVMKAIGEALKAVNR